jgi:D-glycero-beta-D-manno-heptose-7-phosphate kinase
MDEHVLHLLSIVTNFKGKRIGVLGDVMLDRFIYGKTERISQEAPIPIVEYMREELALGGAANIASNIKTLGGKVNLFGVIGHDSVGSQFLKVMRAQKLSVNGIIKVQNRATTEKIRVVSGSQQIVRIDRENTARIARREEDTILVKIKHALKSLDAFIFVDYGKGVITESLVALVLSEVKKRNIPILVNPKKVFKIFRGITLFNPNEKEVCDMTGERDSAIGARKISRELGCDVLVTESARGMTLYMTEHKQNKIIHIPAKAKEVYDEAGASDTVTAVASIALVAGANMQDTAYLANLSAGIVVGKRGVAQVTVEELSNVIKDNKDYA